MNSKWKKNVWQVTLQLYMESGFSHTQRNNYLFDIALLTILESEKFKSGGFFPYILTTTFQCSLFLDDAWNSDQHFPKTACIYWTRYGLSAHHYTVLSAACFMLLALKTSEMLHRFGQKWQPEGISCVTVASNTAFPAANCKIFSKTLVSCFKCHAIDIQRTQTCKC